jgi:transposase
MSDAPVAAPVDPLTQIRESTKVLIDEERYTDANELALSALESVLHRNRDLELLVRKLRRECLGKTSERIDPAQLELLFEELKRIGDDAAASDNEEGDEAQLNKEIEAAKKDLKPSKRKRKKRGDWLSPEAPRKVHAVEPAPELLVCSTCSDPKSRIGVDVTRRVVFVPGSFIEHEYQLGKYACNKCKDSVATASAPPQVLARCAADSSLLAHVAVSKFVDHMPLTRLSRSYERLGASIPVSTLADWVAGVGDLLEPVVDKLMERVLGAYIVRTDATGLKVFDTERPKNIQHGSMWCYVGDDRDVVFRYTETGEGKTGPWKVLAGRTGYIQADAHSVHDRLFNGKVATAVECGCWAHARRKFFDLHESDFRAAYPLKQINQIFRVEKLAKLKQLSPDERLKLRQARTQGYLDKLTRWLTKLTASEPPSSNLAKAAAYCINQWTALTRFMEDGQIEADNTLCERQIRDLAVGRKNFLFAGSHDAARRIARIYSLTRTCAMHGVKPWPYLTDVLTRLAGDWDPSRLDELLPDRWQDLHAKPAAE